MCDVFKGAVGGGGGGGGGGERLQRNVHFYQNKGNSASTAIGIKFRL
jgi:hypothetical protein